MSEVNYRKLLTYVLRNDLSVFVQRVFNEVSPNDSYIHNWHIDCICDYLNAVEGGDIKKLIIATPPRSMKTITISIAWSAWLLGKNPARQIVGASHTARLSADINVAVRSVLESEWYQAVFPETELEKGDNTKTLFKTSHKGGRNAVSVGAKIRGINADYILVDDPIDPSINELGGISEADRHNTNQWLANSLFTRRNVPEESPIVLVMQRIHQDDPVGYLLERDQFETLVLPAQYERKTFYDIGNKQYVLDRNELLFPERMSANYLESEERRLGTFNFAAQFMQKPAPPSGGLVKKHWFKVYEERPLKFDKIIHSWDIATTKTTTSDFSALTVWGVRQEGYYLLKVLNEKWEFPDLKNKLIALAERENPDYVLIEQVGIGTPLVQEVQATSNINVVPIKPEKDKETRLHAITPMIEGGNVYLPNEAEWLNTYIDQMSMFPRAKHDDMVDSTTQFLSWIKTRFDNYYDDDYDDYDIIESGRDTVTGY